MNENTIDIPEFMKKKPEETVILTKDNFLKLLEDISRVSFKEGCRLSQGQNLIYAIITIILSIAFSLCTMHAYLQAKMDWAQANEVPIELLEVVSD